MFIICKFTKPKAITVLYIIKNYAKLSSQSNPILYLNFSQLTYIDLREGGHSAKKHQIMWNLILLIGNNLHTFKAEMGERNWTGMCWWKKETVRISKNMLKLTKGLLNQIPNILCSLEKDSGSMILAIKASNRYPYWFTISFCKLEKLRSID